MQDNQDFINSLHQAEKIKKSAYKILRFWAKNEENFEKFLKYFDKKSVWKFDFFTVFTSYFWDFSLLRNNIPLED